MQTWRRLKPIGCIISFSRYKLPEYDWHVPCESKFTLCGKINNYLTYFLLPVHAFKPLLQIWVFYLQNVFISCKKATTRALTDVAAATGLCSGSSQPVCPLWTENVHLLETITTWRDQHNNNTESFLLITVSHRMKMSFSELSPDRWSSALQCSVKLQTLMRSHSPVSASQHQ